MPPPPGRLFSESAPSRRRGVFRVLSFLNRAHPPPLRGTATARPPPSLSRVCLRRLRLRRLPFPASASAACVRLPFPASASAAASSSLSHPPPPLQLPAKGGGGGEGAAAPSRESQHALGLLQGKFWARFRQEVGPHGLTPRLGINRHLAERVFTERVSTEEVFTRRPQPPTRRAARPLVQWFDRQPPPPPQPRTPPPPSRALPRPRGSNRGRVECGPMGWRAPFRGELAVPQLAGANPKP